MLTERSSGAFGFDIPTLRILSLSFSTMRFFSDSSLYSASALSNICITCMQCPKK